ncbi:MAG: bacillithiol biosynthesis protein BshC [Candidatus Thorarchaeota archaeon]|jgi:hypothetical protein
MEPSVFNIYQDFIWRGDNPDLAKRLYNTPPVTMEDIADKTPALLDAYKDTLWHIPERTSILKQTLIKVNKELGILTPKMRENINTLSEGAVESAHQTVVMGGPAFILNKAITAVQISSISSEKGVPLTPYFFVADYDIVQTELTHIRTPIMGSGGNLVSIPVPKGFEHSPVSVLPLPGSDWFNQVEEELRAGYRPMFKGIIASSRKLYEERLEQALSILRLSFLNSDTLGEWSQRIMGQLFNIIGNLGIPIIPASHKEIRELFVEGIEFLLAQENRERFLKTREEITDLIGNSGYAAGTGRRNHQYVPFFYECPEQSCNSSRTELHYEDRGSSAVLTGKCPSCSQDIEIETSADSPFLGEIAPYMSPRVDSRQMIVDTLLPTVAHVGGPGEAAYYAQIIPAAEAMSIPFPFFIRYPRVYFNTPWNESLALSLKAEDIEVLHGKDLFVKSGKVGRFRKKQQYEEMNESLYLLGKLIVDSHAHLNLALEDITAKAAVAKGKELEKLQLLKIDLERYLSWTFGQFAENKLGQESSWSWIEWAINSGFSDLFGPYERAFVGPMKNGATAFVNFSI